MACAKDQEAQIEKVSEDGRWVQLYMPGNSDRERGWMPASRVKVHRWPFAVKISYRPAKEPGMLEALGGYAPFPIKAKEVGYVVSQSTQMGPWFNIALPFRPPTGPRQGWVPGDRLEVDKSSHWGES